MGIPAEVIDMKDYDPDDRLADEVSQVQKEDAFPCNQIAECRDIWPST